MQYVFLIRSRATRLHLVTYFLPPALERIKNMYCMGQRPFLYLYCIVVTSWHCVLHHKLAIKCWTVDSAVVTHRCPWRRRLMRMTMTMKTREIMSTTTATARFTVYGASVTVSLASWVVTAVTISQPSRQVMIASVWEIQLIQLQRLAWNILPQFCEMWITAWQAV